MSDELSITIDRQEIVNMLNQKFMRTIDSEVSSNDYKIKDSIKKFLDTSYFTKTSKFDNALDYVVERHFQECIEKAFEKVGFKDVLIERIEELLS